MQLRSVNVGRPKPVDYGGKVFQTAVFKDPVQDRVQVTKHVLEGDGQADLVSHGGEFMAVYAYPFEHYDHWATELDRQDFVPGQFGENLTIEGLLEDEVYIGDVHRQFADFTGVSDFHRTSKRHEIAGKAFARQISLCFGTHFIELR